MVTVSLCMIVRDEASVLERCLRSVGDVADEIIIVDTGSQDETKEIAARFTGKIYDFAWIDDFAAARNFAFSKGSMDFLMWLDADDLLLDTDREAFVRLKKTLSTEVDVVMAPYHTAFDGQGNPLFVYYRERLIRRAAGFQWEGAIHEAIAPAGRVIYTEAAVTHRKMVQKDPDRNLRIFRKMLAQGRRLTPREQFYYGRELYYHGLYAQAEDELLAFLDREGAFVENKIDACRQLSYCYQAENRPMEALDALFRSFRYDEPRAETCCEIGKRFMEAAAYPQAVYWYKQALSARRRDHSGAFVLPDCYGYLPAIQLCVCYERMGNRVLAEEFNERAGQYKPTDPSYLHNKEYFARQKNQAVR